MASAIGARVSIVPVTANLLSPSAFQAAISELEKATIEQLKKGSCDGAVQEALKLADSLQKLKDVAYVLFSGERHIRNNSHLESLTYLVLDRNIDISDLSQAIQFVFNEWKKAEAAPRKTESVVVQGEKVWRDEEWVVIHHGGGLKHIQAFLKQESKSGYSCDAYGRGMYFTPVDQKTAKLATALLVRWVQHSRTPTYACRTPVKHFDQPTILIGKIQAQYLKTTCNSYEVVIPHMHADKIEILALTNLDNRELICKQLPFLTPSAFLDLYKENEVLGKRLLVSFQRVAQEFV